ncbi:lysophospholipid acyltransferase family protein [Chromatium okenii]|uniref:lysophospholipid acyltransferase family protein n=1 Tax=Chromatium okenii TaxID=61644 RepID=UPI00322154E7
MARTLVSGAGGGSAHERADRANALLVSNHISWLDIPVIGAQGEIGFLAKTDVREWPLIGWLADHAGTLFIERGGHQVAHIAAQLGHAIAGGRTLMIFPEGTPPTGKQWRDFMRDYFRLRKRPVCKFNPLPSATITATILRRICAFRISAMTRCWRICGA